MRLARHYQAGSKKYDERNWEKGIPIGRCYNSAMRHLVKYLVGDGKEDHLAAAAWNIFAMMHYEEMIARRRLSPTIMNIPCYAHASEIRRRLEEVQAAAAVLGGSKSDDPSQLQLFEESPA